MASMMIEGRNSPRMGDKSMGIAAMSSPMQGVFLMVQVALRVMAAAFTVVAIVALLVSHQSLIVVVLAIEARYTDSPALKYKFIADSLGCAFSVLSLIVVLLLIRRNPTLNNYFLLFLHDGGVAVLLGTGSAAGTTIGLVSRDGLDSYNWPSFCNYVTRFCHKVTISIAFSHMAFASYCILTVLSVYKVKACAAPINYHRHHQPNYGISTQEN